MIAYKPTDSDPLTSRIQYRPRTCFVMTQLGGEVPDEVVRMRADFAQILAAHGFTVLDASSQVTGRDFLLKIWNMILSVPVGAVLVDESMSKQTWANIFYEVGMLKAYGKEAIVIKTPTTKVPSDLIRDEYIQYDEHFQKNVGKYLAHLGELAEYFEMLAEQVENNPLLAIDYLRRSYLLTGDVKLRTRSRKILDSAGMGRRARNSVEILLADF